MQAPLATLQAARDKLRGMGAARAAATVLLRAGTYYMPSTLLLDGRDSNTVYSAYPGERVVLSGGRLLSNLSWSRYQGDIWVASGRKRAANEQNAAYNKRFLFFFFFFLFVCLLLLCFALLCCVMQQCRCPSVRSTRARHRRRRRRPAGRVVSNRTRT